MNSVQDFANLQFVLLKGLSAHIGLRYKLHFADVISATAEFYFYFLEGRRLSIKMCAYQLRKLNYLQLHLL